MHSSRGRYSRGYLPHIDLGPWAQFLTWRLADALPETVLLRLRAEAELLPESQRRAELARQVEAYCDAGHGSCALRDPRAARACQETLFESHGRTHELHAWVVMPNHIHVLLTPVEGVSLAEIMRKLKGVSSRRVNLLLGRSGRLWQPESFDRWIRSENHFAGAKRYIEWNPVKAKLCSDPSLYPWSSASESARARLTFFPQTEV